MKTADKKLEPNLECFEQAFLEQPVLVRTPLVSDYCIEIEIENVLVKESTERTLREKFGGVEVKVRTIVGTSKVTISVPRVTIPNKISASDHLKFLKQNADRGVWLGLAAHGPEFLELEKIVHAAIIGSSGYGKAACVRAILAQLAFLHDDVRIAIIDPKGGTEFQFIENSPTVILVAKSLPEWLSLPRKIGLFSQGNP